MSFKISPISPERVKQLCNGEVRVDKTLNFKNKLPVRDGLFCQRIFGPIKDYVCECKRYNGKKYTGKICENCGVSVISSRSRSERMGYIDLQLPIVNPIATDAVVSILNTRPKTLESFLSGKSSCVFVETDKGANLCLKDGRIGKVQFVKLDDPLVQTCDQEYTESSIALYNIFEQIHTDRSLELKDSKFLKLYKNENFDILNLFLKLLPVSPPNYRALIPMNGFYTTDSKNDLYLRICRRSIRLKRVIQLEAIKPIICHENNLIYKAVANLFFGGSIDGKFNELKGIMETISGKNGIVRKNLLGKRVDYSGRTAITSSGDRVAIDEIGLPRQMAYELFKPFIISEILKMYAETYKEAVAIYKQRSHIAIKSMEKVVSQRRVLMNRAPTLHRYGIMSFKVKLIEGKVILLHPLICVPFNADFDGDAVAIHVPLSKKALDESTQLMSPEHNILASLDSQPQFNPSHEMVIGLDIMTRIKEHGRHSQSTFNSMQTLEYLYSTFDGRGKRNLEINEQIFWKDSRGKILTCLGRLMLEQALKNRDLPERFNKTTIKKLISVSYDNFEPKDFLKVLDEIMKMSLNFVTLSGFSVASSDCRVPSTKSAKIEQVQTLTKENTLAYQDGFITEEQRFEDNVRLWDGLVKELQQDWKTETDDDNAVKMMLTTGARVSMTQVSQLNVAKGLVTDTGNKIKETPILNSLIEGLTPLDYFSSCSGSRKSMDDKRSLTPDSGYLTRRMVTVSRDFFIVEQDCKTTKGIFKQRRKSVGRFTCDGDPVEENNSTDLIKIRTPIHCEASKGICAKCYGVNPATRKQVTVGSNIGTIAAQSLTESTTQMTMKTFHTSGAAVVKDSPLVVKSLVSGSVEINDHNKTDPITRITVTGSSNQQPLTYFVHTNKCRIFVKNGSRVEADDILAVYTHEGLENDDVSGSLPRVEALYELRVPTHAKACIIAPTSGNIRLEAEGDVIVASIDDQVVGTSGQVPMFVAHGQTVRAGDILNFGSPDIGSFYEKTQDLNVAYQVFESSVLGICEKENILPNPIHVETIFRCMSNLVMRDDGLYGLRSHGDQGAVQLVGIEKLGRIVPSWLKSIGFGYTERIIKSSAVELRKTYDLSSEKLIYGGLIFETKS